MNVLITGISGFVGEYLANYISKCSPSAKIFGLERNIRKFEIFPKLNKYVKIIQVDLTDYNSVYSSIKIIKPDQIYHLAGFASASGKDKKLIFNINVSGTINLLKSVNNVNPKAGIVLVSTSYVYGDTIKPVKESGKLSPRGLYAESKMRMEENSLKKFNNIDIKIVRPVNHTGPGQRLGFVIPDFSSQIIKSDSGEIHVGNLSAEREFLDVRDVVRAYYLVMKKGKSGEIYNISRGQTVSIQKLLQKIIKYSGKSVKIVIDKNKMKPVDIKKNCLNPAKIGKLGWKPKIAIDKTLKDVFVYWKKIKVSNENCN